MDVLATRSGFLKMLNLLGLLKMLNLLGLPEHDEALPHWL